MLLILCSCLDNLRTDRYLAEIKVKNNKRTRNLALKLSVGSQINMLRIGFQENCEKRHKTENSPRLLDSKLKTKKQWEEAIG